MRQTNFALALLTAAILSACGGSDNNNDSTSTAKPKFLAQVNFGDSLSDVGTYKVGTVAALGGGKYTINGNLTATNAALTGKVWPELIAAQLSLSAPCAAQTGLMGSAANGFSVPVVNNPQCTNYAQGGARVTDPVGPGNKAGTPLLGQLTVPVTAQIDMHLERNGGKFTGNEVVFVMAGGNDALQRLSDLNAAANAAGSQEYVKSLIGQLAAGTSTPATSVAPLTTAFNTAYGTELAKGSASTVAVTAGTTAAIGTAARLGFATVVQPAVNTPITTKAMADAAAAGAAYGAANGPAQATAMSLAGREAALLVRDKLIAKGAKYVVVNNLPSLGDTPFGKALPASSQTLVNGMVSAFNTALRANLDGMEANVLHVDLYTVSVDQVANPSKYGITNASAPACLTTNALGGTSLVCTGANLATGDVSHYMFADAVHPTPFGSSLIAKVTAEAMVARGWL